MLMVPTLWSMLGYDHKLWQRSVNLETLPDLPLDFFLIYIIFKKFTFEPTEKSGSFQHFFCGPTRIYYSLDPWDKKLSPFLLNNKKNLWCIKKCSLQTFCEHISAIIT